MVNESVTKDDQQWFDALYTKNFKKLFIMAKRVMHSEAIAEELVQDVFLVCICKLGEVRQHEDPDKWLAKTMKNLLGNELRRASRTRECSLDDMQNIVPADIASPFEELLPQGLTAEERQLLIWYFKEQLAYEEIAGRLHISVLACRTRVFRAKEHCRALLAT